MARLIGESMRTLGVHQGLAPVLDVIRDPRWGRVDECIAEDPYVVGTIGTAYVRGLQDAGVDATLKHFVGYSASRSGRNHAPVSAGPREVADVLPAAVRDGRARRRGAQRHELLRRDRRRCRSPRRPRYLTDLLREQWGFDGVVVADYFSVAVPAHDARDRRGPRRCGRARPDRGDRRRAAEHRGATARRCANGCESGELDEALVDRAVIRVLAQKERARPAR